MPKKKDGSLWEDVTTWLTDAAGTAIREAEDLTRRGRLKMEILRLSQQTEKLMGKLGGRVYLLLGSGPGSIAEDTTVSRLVAQLRQLESELARLRTEYEAEKKKR
ncbi:MAG: hypothetical protein R6X13_02900 [bacterium]